MNIADALKKVERELPRILEDYAKVSQTDMLTEIDLNFDKPSLGELYRNPSTKASLKPNTGKRLRLVTGNLIASYNPRDKNTASKVDVSNYVMTEVYGSLLKYAKVHETGDENIPKRPYLAPAIKAHSEESDERIQKYILDEIIKIFK